MAKKKNTGSPLHLLKYLLLIPAILGLANNVVFLIKFEASMMQKKLWQLCLLLAFIFILIMSIWLGASVLLALYLLSLNMSLLLSVTLILVMNFFLLLIACLGLALVKRQLSFPETREFIRSIISE